MNSNWKHDLTGQLKNMTCQWSTYNKEEKMFVILTNRIDQKQTSVAENKLFSLEKYVLRNNSPNLPVARNVLSPSSVWTGGNYALRVTLKKRKTHFSHLSYWTAQRQRQGQRLKDAVEYRIAKDFYHCCRWSNHHYSRGYLVRFYFNKIRFNNYIILSKQKRCIILFTYSFFFFFFLAGTKKVCWTL